MMSDTYLRFPVEFLKIAKLWPADTSLLNTIKQYYVTVLFIITATPIAADLIAQCYEEETSFNRISENLVALNSVSAVIYVAVCFIDRIEEIMELVADLKKFENYSSKNLIEETDKSTEFYTKLFLLYGIIGNVCYAILPLLGFEPSYRMKFGIFCGLITAFAQCGICILISTVIIIISMLICGILMHITEQLKCLKERILDLSNIDERKVLETNVKSCIQVHIAIIDYATKADSCFSQIMLLHITWTGFIVSVLGFEVAATANLVERIRFFLHLLGWIGILFLMCFCGQRIMDESVAISKAAYSFCWYKTPLYIQKYIVLIIFRSQKPLTLKAAGMRIMSLQTFLSIVYSAYSHFNLLLKINRT